MSKNIACNWSCNRWTACYIHLVRIQLFDSQQRDLWDCCYTKSLRHWCESCLRAPTYSWHTQKTYHAYETAPSRCNNCYGIHISINEQTSSQSGIRFPFALGTLMSRWKREILVRQFFIAPTSRYHDCQNISIIAPCFAFWDHLLHFWRIYIHSTIINNWKYCLSISYNHTIGYFIAYQYLPTAL